ncbi:MAG: GreA/GreB family elongation factor [Acidobacteria bacterium]|nr:GreA/GreB family elongation factor [Acidobacteriota bacterium]
MKSAASADDGVDSIDISKIPTDSIAYGIEVVLYDLEKEEEGNIRTRNFRRKCSRKGKISTVSPISQALMGKQEATKLRSKHRQDGEISKSAD